MKVFCLIIATCAFLNSLQEKWLGWDGPTSSQSPY